LPFWKGSSTLVPYIQQHTKVVTVPSNGPFKQTAFDQVTIAFVSILFGQTTGVLVTISDDCLL